MKRMYRLAPYTAACIIAAMWPPVPSNSNSNSNTESNNNKKKNINTIIHHHDKKIRRSEEVDSHSNSSISGIGRNIRISTPYTTRRISAMIETGMIFSHTSLCEQRRGFRKELFEGPLDLKPGERNARKGPPVAHSLPVYKTAHKLNNSVRWKNANLIANVAGGKDYRLRETQSEGTFDETGMYRDWLYGDERRYANYIGVTLGLLSIGLFFYTMRVMGTETWDIPAPVLASQRKKAAAAAAENNNINNINEKQGGKNNGESVEQSADALAMLKRPAIVSKTVA
ncbi:hypothetical protein LSM04_005816 [Trypanosoma melophagium]|uniref:uncharacterized protein n=1 Tax=Trypanosoma melophagium TaxID=715481 RepID=UPI00351A2008|nr:hypothetical protein LSM04_005816 [Trypanosoma melophagium]